LIILIYLSLSLSTCSIPDERFLVILLAPGVAGGRNHPEALQRLFEMELRSNSKPIHTSGHNQGIHGHELDMGFGYR
jgi:hypothetical protein